MEANEPTNTRWSRILAGDMDYVVRRYFKPVRRFLADRLGSLDEAEDVTQDLFVAFLQRDLLGRADATKGSFRTYLFQCARRFLIDHHRRGSAARRDARREVPLDVAAGARDDGAPDPVASFDREWFLSLFNLARRELKERCEDEGRPEVYRAFRLFYFGESGTERWTQARVAERLGLPVSTVNNLLHRARRAFAARVRAAIAEYAADDAEADAELAAMARSLGAEGLPVAEATGYGAEGEAGEAEPATERS